MQGKIFWIVGVIICCGFLAACSKELSWEQGNGNPPSNTSEGTLNGAPNACANFGIVGAYGQGLSLDTAAHQVTVEVDFTRAGTFHIFTDTVNGMWFKGVGTITNLGLTTVTLHGFGTPLNPGTFTFFADYKGARCSFDIQVCQAAVPNGSDYFPMTTDSWWTYLSNQPGAPLSDTARQLSTGVIGTIPGGNTFNLFKLIAGSSVDSAYYRKSGNDYFEFGDMDVAGVADAAVPAEWTFLKDNAALGAQWQSPEMPAVILGNAAKIRLQFEVLAKNIPVLVGNKVFANTIKIKVTQQVQAVAPTWMDAIQYEAWYALGIGRIHIVAPSPIYGYHVTQYKVN